VFVLNGDTFLELDYTKMLELHRLRQAEVTIALKPLEETSRYGNIGMMGDRIVRFKEKGDVGPGLISAGIYLLNRSTIEALHLPEVFSFEQDFLAVQYAEMKMYGYVSDTYFIDIGIPEDYERAQTELPQQFKRMALSIV